MSDRHDKRYKEILSQVKYATIATSSNTGKPWNSPVAHFFDSEGNVCWFSAKDSVHSKNIRENKDVFIVIYDSTIPVPNGDAVYIEAEAHEVNDIDELTKLIKDHADDWSRRLEQTTGEGIHRYYRSIAKNIWVNDAETDENGKYIKDIRVEVVL